jgi:hypothetical protein
MPLTVKEVETCITRSQIYIDLTNINVLHYLSHIKHHAVTLSGGVKLKFYLDTRRMWVVIFQLQSLYTRIKVKSSV